VATDSSATHDAAFKLLTIEFLNHIIWCDHSFESSRRDDSIGWPYHRNWWDINKLFIQYI